MTRPLPAVFPVSGRFHISRAGFTESINLSYFILLILSKKLSGLARISLCEKSAYICGFILRIFCGEKSAG